MSLADDTIVYCAHEYTQANTAFALTVEPGNQDLLDRSEEINRLRANNIPTVPHVHWSGTKNKSVPSTR